MDLHAECRARLDKLRQRLAAEGLDGFMVTQNVDLYYFIGSMQNGFLWVPAVGDPVFYVRRSVVRAQEEAVCSVEPLGSLRGLGERLRARHPDLFAKADKLRIATEFDVLPVQMYQRLQQAIPEADWADGSRIVRELRMIKSPAEIACIRASARVIDRALEDAISRLKPGMTDLELVETIESFARRHGHAGVMRMRGFNQELITGMVASGADAAVPTYFDGPAGGPGLSPASPQGSGRKPIREGEPILIDIGCCIDGYVIDQTRTAVIGELPEHLKQAYAVAEHILKETEARLKPGTRCEDLYTHALALANEAGLAAHFMGYGDDQVKFLGHGIGLEIDEFPVLARGFAYPLEPGMVIAVEPKFTFPGEGVVGIENTYVITEDGFEKLTLSREGILVC
jgi:Xaa-Pro aminopeptidase